MVFMVWNPSEMGNFQETKVTNVLLYTSYNHFMSPGIILYVRDAFSIYIATVKSS